MNTRWWRSFPPAGLSLECGGEDHRIEWRRGKLVLLDHSLAAEETLVGLGGVSVPCMEVLDAWRRATANPGLLVELSRMPILQSSNLDELLRRYEAALMSATLEATSKLGGARTVAALRAARIGPWQRALLTNLPSEMRVVLIAALAFAAERRGASVEGFGEYDVDKVLEDRVRLALDDSIRSWTGPGTSQRVMVWEVAVTKPDEPAHLQVEESDDGYTFVTVGVPLRWMATVWARGVSVVDGCFVLEAAPGLDDDHVRARAVRWERRKPAVFVPVEAPAILARPAERWSLWWA